MEDNSSKRGHTRYKVSLPARFALQGILPQECVVEDFCFGGVFLKFSDEVAAYLSLIDLHRRRPIQVDFSLEGEVFLLVAKMARRTDYGMGLFCDKMPEKTFKALQKRHQTEPNSSSQASSPGPDKKGSDESTIKAADHLSDQAIKRIKSDLFQAFLKSLEPRIGEYFKNLPDYIWAYLEQSQVAKKRQSLSDLASNITKNRISIEQAYFSLLENKVKYFFNKEIKLKEKDELFNLASSESNSNSDKNLDAPFDKNSGLELTMIESDDFEIWLSVKVCSQRLESFVKHNMYIFRKRMEYLFGKIDNKCPLLPMGLAIVLKETMAGYVGDKTNRDIIFTCFVKYLSSHINQVYGVLNDVFVSHEILTNEKQVWNENKRARAADHNNIDKNVEGKSEVGGLAESQSVIGEAKNQLLRCQAELEQDISRQNSAALNSFAASKRLMTKLKKYGSMSSQQAALSSEEFQSVPTLSIEDIHESVYKVQTKISSDFKAEIKDSWGDELEVNSMQGALEKIEQQNPKNKIQDEEKEAAEIIDFVFDHLSNHNLLNLAMRKVLDKFRFPYYQMFLDDPELFDKLDGPPYKTLDCLTRIGIKGSGWNKKIEQAVLSATAKILESEKPDADLFKEILTELKPIVLRSEKIYLNNVVRLLEKYKGHESIKNSQNKIVHHLCSFREADLVPFWFDKLVSAGWQKLLELSLIRKGEESHEYKMACDLLAEVYARIEKDQYNTIISISDEELLDVVKGGLEKIPAKKALHEACMNMIGACLQKKDDLSEFRKPIKDKFEIVHQSTDSDDALPEEKNKKAKSKKVHARHLEAKKIANTIQVGNWVEFPKNPEETQKTRVAWISGDKDKYIFVNYLGIKAIECGFYELVGYLEKKDAAKIDGVDIPLVEQGLDHYVDNIFSRVRKGSLYDSLTGLPNRMDLEKRLGTAIYDYYSMNVDYSMIYFDLDAFGMLNNACGYEVADLCLKGLVNLLKDTLDLSNKQSSDASGKSRISNDNEDLKIKLLSRVSGNAFCYLSSMNQEEAYAEANNIFEAINQFKFNWEGKEYRLQVSMGIFTFIEESLDAETALSKVKLAVDIAKNQGGNCIHVYKIEEDKENKKMREIFQWVAHVDQAIAEDRLYLRAQPIQSLSDSESKQYYEILLGVNSESGEQISIGDYLMMAEKYNRMSRIDMWVVDNALQWLRDTQSITQDIEGITINLSGSSLNDQEFLDFLFERLNNFELPRSLVGFEITETEAVKNIDVTRDFMLELKQLGCRFWLDDFGAGMSSYVYLKRLPIDFLKIDGSFMRQLTEDSRDLAIVKSILEIGHAMGVKVVAECVETEETFNLLKSIEVDFIQGYYLGRGSKIGTKRSE